MSLFIEYPETLPIPQTSVITPAERRQLSQAERPRDASPLSRDRLEFERITWPPLSAAQAEELRTWWESTLHYGGRYFRATWPTPRGLISAVHRLLEAPRWQFVPGGFWAISALAEIRGRGLEPVRMPATLSLLHFDGDLIDEVGGSYSAAGTASVPTYVDGAAGFGQASQYSFSIGGVGQNAITRAYEGDSLLVPVDQWQIDAFLTLTAGGFQSRTLVSVTRDDDASQTPLISVAASSSSTNLRTQVRTVENGGSANLDAITPGAYELVAGQRTHIRIAYRAGVFSQYHDGVLVAQLSGRTFWRTVSGSLRTRISIGATPAGANFGSPVFAALMGGTIDEFRLASEVTDNAEFDPPTRPFTLPT